MNNCPCHIPNGGWCTRHRVQKAAHWVRLCKNNEKYWLAWEEGRGPGQNGPKRTSDVRPRGVGTILKKLLGCDCKINYLLLDEWGPDKCEQDIEQVVVMVLEAPRKNGRISEDSARRLAMMAIKQARLEAEENHGNPTQV